MFRPGLYLKTTPVWAQKAESAGSIRTKEGSTSYEAGDYIVYNEPDGEDGYVVSKERVEKMYTRANPAEYDDRDRLFRTRPRTHYSRW